MSSLDHRHPHILMQGQGIHLSGNPIQTENFSVQKTLRDGGKIRFKIRYSAELKGFCLLEVFLMRAQNRTQVASSMTIPNSGTTANVQEQEREFSLWEPGDYYFFFKMSSNNGTFYIEEYQLYWSAS
ncbi:MAG: hypothetical protein V7L14_23625 [Nostoc sp.]|uniref:hypothetical protein n=1 Tax=Nostoc sp. TaxID=1180 RepID=UPI002FF67E76